MKVYRGLSDPALKRHARSAAIGIFDGVHRAHTKILHRALRQARLRRLRSMFVTFDPHPEKVLSGDCKNTPIILSLEHRLRAVAALGFDEAVVIRFDRRFSRITPLSFIRNVLNKKLGVRVLSVGHDFRFGRRGAGDTGMLAALGRENGYDLFVCPAVKHRGRVISSTAIRVLIEKGRLKEAEALLGRPVSVYGTVIHGLGRGHHIGFPTANLDPHQETLPPPAVYAVRGLLGRTKLKGVLHIGSRPTFGEKEKTVEVHFLNWHHKLYGREIELFFVKKIRPIRRFSGPAALKRAIRSDIRRARKVLARKG